MKRLGVDAPLAGPLLADRVLENGATVPLDGNIMRVAEAEFAFRFRTALLAVSLSRNSQNANPFGLPVS